MRALMRLAAGLAAADLVECRSPGPEQTTEARTEPRAASERNADQFLVVDCLLPGKVRKLGSRMTYIGPRRAIKSSARDCEIRGGEYTAYDRASYADALRVWMPLAEDGDAEAQMYVGEIFERGVGGGAPDPAAAVAWYTKSAQQGYGPAQQNLGSLYERGVGVEKDPNAARDWYRRAAGLEKLSNEYVSFVSDAKAQEKLRSELARSDAETRALRQRVKGLEQQAAAAREQRATGGEQIAAESEALASERGKLQQESGRLEEERRALARQRNDLASRQAAASADEQRSAELQRLAKDLSQRERDLDKHVATVKAGEAANDKRAEQLEARKRELDQRDTELRRLAAEAEARRAEYANHVQNGTQIVVGGPTLQLVDPELELTRATAPSTVYSAQNERRIVGRVQAPAGLLTLLVNGVEEKAGADGFFETKMRVSRVGTPVEIVAIDQQGKRANRQFILKRKPGAADATASQPVALERRALGVDFGRYTALVIGNTHYSRLESLPSAVADARAVAELFQHRYGFKVIALYDADRYAILSALNDLRTSLGPDDNLIVYYAGHGELDEVNQRGHWLPVDAERNNPANWISNVAITDIINAMEAKHVMVVADSCYSGALTESGIALADEALGDDARTQWQKSLIGRRARTALTSGGLEPVLDDGGDGHSIFARAFIDVLKRNHDVLEGRRLYQEIAAQVTFRARTRGFRQEPRYAPIRFSRHEAGDFFFVPTS
jgi:hypothetical protein